MNSTTTKLADAYVKLKHAEWNDEKHEAPEGLNYIGELTDDVFILYQLRVYLRLKSFPKMFADIKGSWNQEHYEVLQQLISLRRSRINRNPLLLAYLRILDILDHPANDADSPHRLEDLLRFLRTHRDQIPREDWVDLCSYVSNYCTAALNRGIPGYQLINLTALVHQVEQKYGDSWKKGGPALPGQVFRNVVKLVLGSAGELSWNNVEIDRIPTTAEPRTVYEWLRLFSKAYRTRLKDTEKAISVNMTEVLIAFHQRDYLAADKWLGKINRVDMDMLNLEVSSMRMIVMYGLATDPTVKKGKFVKQFNDASSGEIKKMEGVITYLANKKEKYPPRVTDHFRSWLTAFSALRSLYLDLVIRGKGGGSAVTRARLVHKKRQSLPKGYKEMVHTRKDWIENEMDKLARGE